MKRFIICIAYIMLTIACMADNLQYLNIAYSGKTKSYAINSLKKLTFSDGNMNVTSSSNATDSYALTTMETMAFSSQPTGIGNISKDEGIYYNSSSQCIYVKGCINKEMQIYAITGQMLNKTDIASNDATIDLPKLSQGLYIINIKGKTIKIRK